MFGYSPFASGLGQRIVFLGDSITIGDEANQSRSYPLWFSVLSNWTHTTLNKGVSGNTTTQMLARFDADVIAHSPTHVFINGGKNDIYGGAPAVPAVTYTNIEAMVAKAFLSGITPVLSTVIPYGDRADGTTTYVDQDKTNTATLNAWIREFARKSGVECVDFHAALADSDGWCKDSYINQDNLHPSRLGVTQLASLVLALWGGYDLRRATYTPADNALANASFEIDSDSNGVPDGWAFSTSGGVTATKSLITHPLGGKMMKVAMSAATPLNVILGYNTLAGWAAGETWRLAVDLLLEDYASSSASSNGLYARFTDSGTWQSGFALAYWPHPFGRLCRFTKNYLVPAGASGLRLEIGVIEATSATYYVGRPHVKRIS